MNEKIRQKIDDLAYRLRCETKRTDLPEGIVRTYAEAYYAIGILQEECREAEDLRQRVKELKEGFEGCCNACEPVGEMNKKLREERDEARREVCGFHHLTGFLAGDYAISRDWNCFRNRDYEFEPSVKDFNEFLKGQDKIFLERVDRLTADRDEARREVCSMNETGLRMNESDKQREAKRRGWDCFKNHA